MAEITKLKAGRANFRLVGKAVINDKSLQEAKLNDKGTWLGVRETFGVETSDGNKIWPGIRGGRSLKNGVLYKFGKERDDKGKSEMLQIPIADRHNPEIIAKVDEMSGFRRATIEIGEDGKAIQKRFLDDIDYVDHLREHLHNGDEIVVTGSVEYALAKDGERVFRNYEVQNVYLNPLEKDKETGEESLKYEYGATITQTYLVDEFSLSEEFKKEIKETGKTAVAVKVPVYLNQVQTPQGDYVDFKEVASLPQVIFVKAADDSKEEIEFAIKKAEFFFKGPKGDKVYTMNIIVNIFEGYEKVEGGEIELSKETKRMIEFGFMKEEDVRAQQVVSRGTAVSELVFANVHASLSNEDGEKTYLLKDQYTTASYNIPHFDNDDEDEAPFMSDVTSSDSDVEDDDDSVGALDLGSLFN